MSWLGWFYQLVFVVSELVEVWSGAGLVTSITCIYGRGKMDNTVKNWRLF